MIRLAGIRLQSGALPYRVEADGSLRVLLVETGRRRRWGIPKGAAGGHRTLAENAAKEAYEEAGVVGIVGPRAVGSFRAIKQRPPCEVVVEVWVFLLQVTDQHNAWPEKGRRRNQWVTPAEAARLLREPMLRELCRTLEPRVAALTAAPPQAGAA